MPSAWICVDRINKYLGGAGYSSSSSSKAHWASSCGGIFRTHKWNIVGLSLSQCLPFPFTIWGFSFGYQSCKIFVNRATYLDAILEFVGGVTSQLRNGQRVVLGGLRERRLQHVADDGPSSQVREVDGRLGPIRVLVLDVVHGPLRHHVAVVARMEVPRWPVAEACHGLRHRRCRPAGLLLLSGACAGGS